LHEIFISTDQYLNETPCKNLAQNSTGILLKIFKTESLLFHVFFSLTLRLLTVLIQSIVVTNLEQNFLQNIYQIFLIY